VILLRCLVLLMAVTGCTPSAPKPDLHYVLGRPYQADGIWYYPREDFSYDETGLAMVDAARHAPANWWVRIAGSPSRLTADGEAFDESALAASHPTLQLPAIARITNLENGRQVVVRINDRGPASPDRILGVTRRTAELLAAADPSAIRVRVQVLEGESRQVVADLAPEGAKLAIAAAPTGSIETESLAPPPGAAQGAGAHAPAAPQPNVGADPPASAPPLRLPEVVTAVPVRPTTLAIDCGEFSQQQYAEMLRARIPQLGAQITTRYDAPRDRAFMVRVGPVANVAAAEAMRRRATAAGAIDARIVVESQ
jgi:rare lipoprotein A